MEGGDFDTASELPGLSALASKYTVPLEVLAVPSIQQWCLANGIDEENAFRSGRVVQHRESGRYVVLLANPITRSMVGGAIGGMMAQGFGIEAEVLWDPAKFVRHLLLHEIAHALDSSRTEAECDSWAFGEMEKSHAV